MARIVPIVFILFLIAAAIGKYKEHQNKLSSASQGTPPVAAVTPPTSIPISPTPTVLPPAVKQTYQPAVQSQTTVAAKSPQLTALERARKEAFKAGKAHGTLEAMKEIERREDKAREEGNETGLIEGKAKGHEEGMKLGKTVGYAKAAAEEFQKGLKQGQQFGHIKGTAEAQKEMMQLIDETEREAKARGEEKGYITGFIQGKEVQRRESFYGVASVVMSTASLFSAMLFFVFTKREPGSVAEYKKIDKERRKLLDEKKEIDAKHCDWVMARWEEQQKGLTYS